jgi:hypothetical protein
MESRLEVRPATAEMFGRIRDVLLEFGPGFGEDEWRRLFDYDFDRDRKDRGWVLFDGDAVVGFLGAIFSRRRGESFCNVTSWIVKKSHRSKAGLQLLLPVLALKDHTILNLSPTPFTLAVFRRMGFRDLEDRLVLIPPVLPQRGPRGYRLIEDQATIDSILQGEDRQVFRDHRRYPCTHLLFAGTHDYSYVVAGKTRLRRVPTSFVYYRSNPELFARVAGPVSRALLRSQRTVLSVIDARLCADAPLRGCPTYKLHQPRLYRPATASSRRREDIDTLYSEFVLLDPRRWTFNY